MANPDSVVFGIHAVAAVVRDHPERVRRVLVESKKNDPRLSALCEKAKQQGLTVTKAKRGELARRSEGGTHQGVLAVCDEVELADEADLRSLLDKTDDPLVLAIDGVEDPRNLGACLRSADAAGVAAVVLPRSRRPSVTGAVQKAAGGSASTLFLAEVPNLVRALANMQRMGIHVTGTCQDAPDLYANAHLEGPSAIVVGGEHKGLRRLTRETCDQLVRIPMFGSVASLNVSVAAGLLLYEARRQRGWPTSSSQGRAGSLEVPSPINSP